MAQRQAMPDVIVVVPGIMGSVLARGGQEVWGVGVGTVAANLRRLGSPVRELALPDGIGNGEPDDGVTATRLMPSAQLIPGFWNLIDGYTELVRSLEARFDVTRSTDDQAGNLVLFPYDWRLSNEVNGRRLAVVVDRALDRWRQAGHPEAKLIFICHSMGGLVARWYIEVLGAKSRTRKLITMGTPFRGAINALENLANGFSPGIGPLRLDLDHTLRSFPSVHELLPTYPCVSSGGTDLADLLSIDIPNVGLAAIKVARGFHQRLADEVGAATSYQVHALKGILQPTSQTARIEGRIVRPIRQHSGEDYGGDGTVPRVSAHPPEWKSEEKCIYLAQKHGALQGDGGALDQLYGILTEKPLRFLADAVKVGLDLPDLVPAGQALQVRSKAEPHTPTLALSAGIVSEHGTTMGQRLMQLVGDEFVASFPDLPPGAYRVTVSSASRVHFVAPVSGLTLVWEEA
jgi:pimeloyl-ACP methyl ester carboxylesterase